MDIFNIIEVQSVRYYGILRRWAKYNFKEDSIVMKSIGKRKIIKNQVLKMNEKSGEKIFTGVLFVMT